MPLILRKLFRRRIVLAAAIALLVVVLVSLFAGPLIGLDPNETAIAQRLSQPSAAHLLGTDELGRDLFARIAFGGRYSLTIALLTALGSVVAGTLFGLASGFFRRLDAPVMILKSCIGNRSLGWDLLPPGSEPYEFEGKTQPGYRGTPSNPKGNGEKVTGEWYAGKQYDDDTEDAKKVLADLDTHYPEAKKYEVAGFFFWQGEKDCGSADHASRYEKNLVHFIKQLRKDFESPDAKFVLATLGESKKGSGGNGGKVLDAQLAVDGKDGKHPEFKGNVATVYSNPLSKGGSGNSHYGGNAETYMEVGQAMGKAMVELLAEGK